MTIAPGPVGPDGPAEPMHVEAGLPVLAIVRTAYEQGLEAGAAIGSPTIGRQGLLEAVNYCADRACERDGWLCCGCRLRTEAAGLSSLDDYCRRHERVEITGPPAFEIRGEGTDVVRHASLEALAKDWAGEEVYYLARRVHRRVHKERAPRVKRLAGSEGEPGDGPAVVLVAPQMAENIGMVARAMANFGLDELRLVDPRDGWPNEKARAAASGANYVIDAARASQTTAEAVADLHWLVATTARQRHMAKTVMTPEAAAVELDRRIAGGQRVGILFGAERQGLENDDIALADAVVMIPVNPRFASLNLAQAVLLVGYEWMRAGGSGTLGRVTRYEAPLEPGLKTRSLPATKEQLIGFFEHLERELDLAGFLKPPHKRPVMVRNLRSLFERLQPTEQDVRTLRGIVASLTYSHKRRGPEP